MIQIDIDTLLSGDELTARYKKDWGIIRVSRAENPNQPFEPLTNIKYIIAIDDKDNKIVAHSGWGEFGGHYLDAGGRVLTDKKVGKGKYQLPKGRNYEGKGLYSKLFDLRGGMLEPKCDAKDKLFIISTSGDKKVIHKSESRGYILYPPELPEEIETIGRNNDKMLFVYVPDSLRNKVSKALRRLLEVQ
tara:strand:+ start:4634 stop:5200 length:567 start_codon:yes stop_codon:yes gene_type:complete